MNSVLVPTAPTWGTLWRLIGDPGRQDSGASGGLRRRRANCSAYERVCCRRQVLVSTACGENRSKAHHETSFRLHKRDLGRARLVILLGPMPTNDTRTAALLDTVNFHHQRASAALEELIQMVGAPRATKAVSAPAGGKKKRVISAAGRRNMKKAQRARWKQIRADAAKPAPKIVKKPARKQAVAKAS